MPKPTTPQEVRIHCSLTASLLECISLRANRNHAKTDRFIPDLVAIAHERADILGEALEEMDVSPVKGARHA